ncbi:GyrI-like domain-containing protein [Algoriphagus terrigena]|uniref:GyrI-like domain-containing protein n=1 Tax=Algoriphagus terrigena TaxID=344884 RepID=UPI000414FF3A|nr:effector binding domain-containing protein [Algoriphagus terrigena]
MDRFFMPQFKLIGFKLKNKTTNEGGQSGIDCGSLWQKFEKEEILQRIPDKLSSEIFAVYFEYEGDYTRPFSYFVGCRVSDDAVVPAEMESLLVPAGKYIQLQAKGVMPGCVADAWRGIWNSTIDRAYAFDYEKYDERSKDWSDATVNIFVSTK